MCGAAGRAVTSVGACDGSDSASWLTTEVPFWGPESKVFDAGRPRVAEPEGIRRNPYLGDRLFEPHTAIRGVVRAEDQQSSFGALRFLVSVRPCHRLPILHQTHTARPTPQRPPLLDTYHPLIWLPRDRQRRRRQWKAEHWTDPEVPNWHALLNEVPTRHINVLPRTPADDVGETSNYSAGNADAIPDLMWGICAVFQRR